MKYSLRMFLELFLVLRKCADVCMESKCLSFELFGNVCFISCQSREAWPSIHQGLSAAFGNSLTNRVLFMQHTQSVQAYSHLKSSTESRNLNLNIFMNSYFLINKSMLHILTKNKIRIHTLL